MIILMLSIMLLLSIFLMSTYTYKLNGVNRILLNPPTPIFESSIPLTVQDDEIMLFYDKGEVINRYNNYLEKELKKYVDSYEANYYFYNVENGGVCDRNDCTGVEIEITMDIMLGYEYKRVMYYEILEGKNHG